MAREWVLRGVSAEELKPSPKLEPPKTPKGKIENYWYHYKWHTIAGVFILIILTVMIWQFATRDNPDYRLIIATKGYISDTAREKIETTLEKYGSDIDGDGKVEVSADVIMLGVKGQYESAGQQKLVANIAAGDVMLWAFDKETFEKNINVLEKDDSKFFAPLETEVDGIEGQGRYWNWKDSDLRKDPAMEGTPEDMYFGIRNAFGTASKKDSQNMHKQCMELIKNFLTAEQNDTATEQ